MSKNLHDLGTQHGAHGEYEREDFSTATIAGSLIGLVVLCVVSAVIVVGMYRYLENTQMEHAAANPMVPMKVDTRHMTPARDKDGKIVPGADPMDVQEVETFPKPRLQRDDVEEMHDMLYDEESRLQSYGWVDQDSGEVRIPVARAMELIAEHGLPVRSAAAPETAAKPAAGAPAVAPQGKVKKAVQ
jgi:hypothetical protein